MQEGRRAAEGKVRRCPGLGTDEAKTYEYANGPTCRVEVYQRNGRNNCYRGRRLID